MPAEVGYSTTINLAAEVTKPPQQIPIPNAVTDLQKRTETREDPSQRQDAVAAADANQGGNTTADRGQNLNITA